MGLTRSPHCHPAFYTTQPLLFGGHVGETGRTQLHRLVKDYSHPHFPNGEPVAPECLVAARSWRRKLAPGPSVHVWLQPTFGLPSSKWAQTAEADHFAGNGGGAVCEGRRLDDWLAGWLFFLSQCPYLCLNSRSALTHPAGSSVLWSLRTPAWPLW